MNELQNGFRKFAAILLLATIVTAGGLVFVVVNYSAVTKEYNCEGHTRVNFGPAEPDQGRLRIKHYAFWVVLWNATSHGSAIFQSTKFSYYEGDLRETGEGNFTVYMGTSQGGLFAYKKATDELAVADGRTVFKGNCHSGFLTPLKTPVQSGVPRRQGQLGRLQFRLSSLRVS